MSSPYAITAGHAMALQVEMAGVERVFCVPGESYLEVLDGLRDTSVQLVTCRQEGGAGFMAVADSRITGNPGVVMVTRGPGITNVSIAIHTAWQDATPLVVVMGMIPIAHVGLEAFQEIDPVEVLGSTCKAVMVLEAPDDAAGMMARALVLAAEGRPGPVVIGVHEDVLTCSTLIGPTKMAYRGAPTPAADEVELFADDIARAERPLIVVGGDGWDDETARLLAHLAEAQSVPITADFRSYDLVDNGSSVYVGPLGFGRNRHLAALMDEADLLVLLGGVRSDVMSDSYTLAADVRTILIGPDPDSIGHVGRTDQRIVCDPRELVRRWSTLPPVTPDAARRDRLELARHAYEIDATPEPDGHEPDLGIVFAELGDRLPGAIVTYGAGCHAAWPTRFLPATRTRSVLGPKNGAMGFGIPAAVAASLARPERQVISVAGDGCFLMNGQELATAVATGASPLILVLDNAMYGTIALHQQHHHPGRPYGTALVNPDFAALARAYGAFGERVECTAEFLPALERALAHQGPSVLHLLTDPDLLLPPVPDLDLPAPVRL